MCYICNWFAWTLDLVQRILTFFLTCWLAMSICCGLSIAVTAGIAYGYNYCLAEFITLTRADVRVYMRRGQFHDSSEILQSKRKSGDEDDMFPYNLSDYNQQVPLADDSLSDKWMKDQDTRKYAAKLDKYSQEKTFADAELQDDLPESQVYYKLTTPPIRRASYVPNRIISTTILQGGSSEIVLRKFETMPDVFAVISETESESNEYGGNTIQDEITFISDATLIEETESTVSTLPPDIRIRVEDSPKGKTIKMRHWRTTAKPVIVDYSPDVDEETVVYRAI